MSLPFTPLECQLDVADLLRAQHEHGLVVEAHPDIHGYRGRFR